MRNNFDNIPYAQWLEHTLKDILNLPIRGLSLHAVLDNGDVYTAYHKVGMNDKLIIAGQVQQDAMTDFLKINNFIKNDEEDADGEEEVS